MAGGAAGATGGMAVGVLGAGGIATALGLSGPPGWLVAALGLIGGLGGGYGGSRAGRAGAGAAYDAAEQQAVEVYNEMIRDIYQARGGVPF